MDTAERKRTFSNNLNKLLDHYHMTQTDLAEAIGERQQTVSNWCKGAIIPRIDKIEKLSDYFSLRLSDILEKSLTEEDKMAKEERELIKTYEELNEEGRKLAQIQMKNLAQVIKYKRKNNNSGPRVGAEFAPDILMAASGSEGMDEEQLEALKRDIMKYAGDEDE